MEPLSRQFYCRDTIDVAKDLLGELLVRDFNGRTLVGRIVETEAYGTHNDPASHAYRGKTERNAAMFGEQGHAYVYFTYGNHFCLNATARDNLPAGAVLIRAIEPMEGIEEMMQNRQTSVLTNIGSGPGKITQAMKITREQNFADLCTKGELYIARSNDEINSKIGKSSRIGIVRAVDKRWRFFIEENLHVSRKLKTNDRNQQVQV
ncbi:MAG TPA: DNA-3-methyladenine glycosylase [Nitrososphaerales archaeon]